MEAPWPHRRATQVAAEKGSGIRGVHTFISIRILAEALEAPWSLARATQAAVVQAPGARGVHTAIINMKVFGCIGGGAMDTRAGHVDSSRAGGGRPRRAHHHQYIGFWQAVEPP